MKNNFEFQWNKSYLRKENFLLYPNEDIIRFFNKRILKRKNIQFNKSFLKNKNCLDLGCGAGRHVVYFNENGLFTYGIDISIEALKIAKELLKSKNINKNKYKLIQSDTSLIPIDDNSIDYIVSHAVLDSMPRENAYQTISEVERILKKRSICYFDFIGSKVNRTAKKINTQDFIITEKHEKNTVQSYFNKNSILKLLSNFEILEFQKKNYYDLDSKLIDSRYIVHAKPK